MAVYVPDPDRTIDEIVEDLAAELADRYREVEDRLIREIAVRAARDLTLANELPTAPAGAGLTVADRRRQNRILAELAARRARAIRELQGIAVGMVERLRVSGLAEKLIEAATQEGEAAAAALLGFADRQATGVARIPTIGSRTAITTTTLTSSATQATAMLAISLQNRLEVLNDRITRYPQDAYQRISAIYSPGTLLGVTTSKEQQARAVQRFLAEGIRGFEDKSGRWWRIGSYAEMAGRTSVARAFNDAGVWRMQQSGIQLGSITGSADACSRCAPWIGKVVSFDGRTGAVEVPHATENTTVVVQIAGTLQDARNAGWGHPNDRCRVVSYAPGLAVPQAGFQHNPEAEKERQRQRELEREVRAARRLEATAMNDTDRQKAARAVRAAQADLRDFTRATGRSRSYAREQLRFADG